MDATDNAAATKCDLKSELFDGKVQTVLAEDASDHNHSAAHNSASAAMSTVTTEQAKPDSSVKAKEPADDPATAREHWDKKTEFLLAVIGFAVDLGESSGQLMQF